MSDWKQRYLQITDRAAKEAENIARRSPQPLYCVVKKSSGQGEWGELKIISQGQPMPDGFDLLTGERFPAHVPYSAWPDFIRRHNPCIIGA